jgi:beta-galactosidase GanA
MVKHGTIENLNAAWGTNYKDFVAAEGPRTIKAQGVDVVDPGGMIVPTDANDLPQWYDWCLFNQQRYANFMREIRDNIKRNRSDLLFTVKWLSNMTGWWKSIGYALNPYDVIQVTDFAGCDSWTFYYGRDPKSYWAIDLNAWYDLAKSIAPDKPILNSEDHLLRNFDPADKSLKFGTFGDVLPWQYFYTSVFRQMVHGQGGGEYWTYWEGSKGYNLNERACAMDAMSQAARDLRRYSNEISTIANMQPKVAVLLSSAALAWNPKDHVDAQIQSYNALTQIGVPAGYMLEEMLPDGALSRYDLLIVPQALHISKAMNDAITQFVANGKTVVVVGDVPSADEYGKPLKFTEFAIVWADLKPLPKDQKDAFDAMHPDSLSSDDTNIKKIQGKLDALLKEKKLAGPVNALVNGELPYGVEWRTVTMDGKLVVTIINYTTKSFDIDLTTDKGAFESVNLLNGEKMTGKLHLDPMGVALLKQ